ncbi:MAG: hypothetical protein AAFO62_05330 [Pseudomonadota bacterium]
MLDRLQATKPQGEALARRGSEYGLTPEQTEAVAEAAAQHLALKLEQRSLSAGGLARLVDLIGRADPEVGDGTEANLGIPVLEELLGSKDGSRFLAQRVANDVGVDPYAVRRILPDIGTQTMAGVAEQTRPTFQKIFDALPQSAGSRTAFPDQAPLPVPGDIPSRGRTTNASPFDSLRDILGGGRRQSAPGRQPNIGGGRLSPGGGMGKMIRDALGGALGYRNRGVVGWIIRFVVARFGWRILQGVFRAFFRR